MSARFSTALVWISATSVHGAILLFSGSSSGNPSGIMYNGPVALSVSFSFTFDDNAVTGVGTEFFNPALSTLIVNPNPIGGTPFTTANSSVRLTYESGVFDSLWVYGNPNGISTMLDSDDFFIDFGSDMNASSLLAVTNPGLVGQDLAPTGTVAIVPEPASSLLFVSGLLPFVMRRRR